MVTDLLTSLFGELKKHPSREIKFNPSWRERMQHINKYYRHIRKKQISTHMRTSPCWDALERSKSTYTHWGSTTDCERNIDSVLWSLRWTNKTRCKSGNLGQTRITEISQTFTWCRDVSTRPLHAKTPQPPLSQAPLLSFVQKDWIGTQQNWL